MQKKKIDINSIIGFALIGAILIWFTNSRTNEAKSQIQSNQTIQNVVTSVQSKVINTVSTNTTQILNAQKEVFQSLENDIVKIKISSKGGQIIQALLKNYTTFDGTPLYIVNKKNQSLRFQFNTRDGRVVNTANLYFVSELTQIQNKKVVTLTASLGENKFIKYIYTLSNDYMLDFYVETKGMANDISSPVALHWDMKTYQHEKSKSYENRYTEMYYNKEDGKIDYLSMSGIDEENEDQNIKWVAYKQHFFSAALIIDKKFKTAHLRSESIDNTKSNYTKYFSSRLPIELKNGEIKSTMNLYYGPNDLKVLNKYDYQLSELVPLGWGIFGVVNKYLIYPVFSFFNKYLGIGVGLAILFLTFVVKMVLSPITYKNFLSSAKMRVIRPEINKLNKKLEKADPIKKNQATMDLYRRAGVNPMAGCLPALLQMPILFAMFRFFPVAIELRQQPFLWATDLSSFDSIFDFGFNIPFYGDHISLFALLMAISTLIYTKMSGNGMAQPSQPGMPNMKLMLYMMPVMMIFFFNDYASGLSYYYLMANVISIVQIILIKKYIVNEDKILMQIEENKKKPQKMSRFQAKMQEMVKKAEQQRKAK